MFRDNKKGKEMKFRPSWKFWLNVVCCLLNLLMFVISAHKPLFWISVLCCVFAVLVWKSEKFIFVLETEALKKAFEKAKKEEESEDVDF